VGRRVALALLAAALVAALIASAATPALAAPSVQPPRALEAGNVPYPEGASGDATVVLELVIDTEGRVRSTAVVEGREPFASAARDAASAWRFSPGSRDGRPVATKIRYQLGFEEQIVAPSPDPDPSVPPPVDAPSKPSVPQVLEVDATDVARAQPSVRTLQRSEIRRLPGAFGDPFRAIEVLPGVTPIVSGLPFFYVRGAPPGNVGYFLDGVRVPYLFHVAAGPSVVHPSLVERVDLHAGGYPARLGRYAGAVVSAETTEPRTDWHGEGRVRIVDAGAFIEGGFADGRGSALLAGRYSYTAGLFSLLSPEITLDYRDFQGRVSFDVTSRDRVSLFAFGAYDFLSQTTDDIESVIFGAEFYRLDARYDARLASGGKLRVAVTTGFDRTRVVDGRNTEAVLLNTRVLLTEPLGEGVTLRGGFDTQLDVYRAGQRRYADPDDPETQAFASLFPARNDAFAGAHTDLVIRPSPAFEIVPGLRVDTFYSNGAKKAAADPRLAVSARVHERVRLLHALGIAHQPPSFIVPLPGLAVGNLSGGLQRSLQASGGVEVALPWKTIATATAFYAVQLNMTDTFGVDTPGDPSLSLPRSLGGAKGLEFYIRRSLSNRIGGFISYTFSRTTRSIGNQKAVSAFDRSHVFHLATSFDLGRDWRAGTRLSLLSGLPRLLPLGFPVELRPESTPRDPVFYRLDFRIEKRWRLTETGYVSLVLEMLNATLNTEVIDGEQIGPVSIPSIGVEGGF
jgi:Gram-negative bacterial TonB protein C-terminal/TonB-dependent Receptor Plug Domain